LLAKETFVCSDLRVSSNDSIGPVLLLSHFEILSLGNHRFYGIFAHIFGLACPGKRRCRKAKLKKVISNATSEDVA